MSKLAVLFPGIGYTTDMPLLYYGEEIAIEKGFVEFVYISYPQMPKGEIHDDVTEIGEGINKRYNAVEDQLKDIKWDDFDEILFISKSIGTIMSSAYAKRHDLNVKQILYTPLMGTYAFNPKNAIAFIGTKDQYSDYREIVRLSMEQEIPVEVYENCNHSLVTKRWNEDIDRLYDIMSKTEAFLS